MANTAPIGRDQFFYLNLGSYSAPTWTLVKRCGDVEIGLEKASSEVDTRESGNTKTVVGNRKVSLSFDYFLRQGATSDTIFDKFETSYYEDSMIDVALMTAAIATPGSKGIRGPFVVTNFTRGEPINENVRHSIELQECFSYESDTITNAGKYTVSGGT